MGRHVIRVRRFPHVAVSRDFQILLENLSFRHLFGHRPNVCLEGPESQKVSLMKSPQMWIQRAYERVSVVISNMSAVVGRSTVWLDLGARGDRIIPRHPDIGAEAMLGPVAGRSADIEASYPRFLAAGFGMCQPSVSIRPRGKASFRSIRIWGFAMVEAVLWLSIHQPRAKSGAVEG